jgi:hypothetical protein
MKKLGEFLTLVMEMMKVDGKLESQEAVREKYVPKPKFDVFQDIRDRAFPFLIDRDYVIEDSVSGKVSIGYESEIIFEYFGAGKVRNV